MTEWYWECNECGSHELTSNVSEEDLEYMACTNCGCDEFHREYVEDKKSTTNDNIKIIYVVLNIDKYNSPEIVDYFLTEDEAQEQVAKLKYLGYENINYERLELRK